MVMVANDRNKEQMDEDLGLFLNDNTLAFTSWLHKVLDKLRSVTLDEVANKEAAKKKKKKKEPKKEKKKAKEEKSKVAKDKKTKKSSATNAKETKNTNKTDLGSGKQKPKPAAKHSEEEEEKEGGEYNAEAILKIAVKSSAKAIKEKLNKKGGTPTKKVKKKTNLREEQEFFKPNKTRKDSGARSRSRSFSAERRREGVVSQVAIVRKAARRRSPSSSEEEGNYKHRRSVASKAILPPR